MQAIMVMQKKIAERTLRVNDNYCVNSQLIMHLSRDPSYMRIFVKALIDMPFPPPHIFCADLPSNKSTSAIKTSTARLLLSP